MGRTPTSSRGSRYVPGRPTAGASRLQDGPVLVAIAALPLTQTLTADVGFPLKVSEIALMVAILFRLTQRQPPQTDRPRAALFRAKLLAAASLASLVAASQAPDRPLDFGLYRIAPLADGFLQLAYLILAIAGMGLVADVASRRRDDVIRWWLRAAQFAAGYSFYLNVAGLAGISFPVLPGTSLQNAQVGSVLIYRAGTFLEGNFFGLYLLISFALALHSKRPGTALIISVALLLTLSTPNILALGALGLFCIVRGARRGQMGFALLAGGVMLAVVTAVPVSYQVAVLGKVSDNSSQSSLERRGAAAAAASMLVDHPIIGVGVGQYALWFPVHRPDFVPLGFLSEGRRQIANNVYAQVAAESGVVGLASLLVFLGAIATRVRRHGRQAALTFALVLLVLNAFPSLTVLFLWAYFGIALSSPRDKAVSQPEDVDVSFNATREATAASMATATQRASAAGWDAS